MANRKQKTQESPKERRAYLIRLAFLWVLYLGLIALLFDLSPVGGGNVDYYAKNLECGHTPFVGRYNSSGLRRYKEAQRTFQLTLGHELYFCTAAEAEQAGYSVEPPVYVQPGVGR